MVKKLSLTIRNVYYFLICKHQFIVNGTCKRKGKIVIICQCEKCKVQPIVNQKQFRTLTKLYSVKLFK